MKTRKRFLLTGEYRLNAGPMNVNRALVLNADGAMDYVRSDNRILRKLERMVKILFHHTIIISGGLGDLEFALARRLHKRIIYIMHGCNRYENVVNRLGLSEEVLAREQRYLQCADKIVAVSENYAGWVKCEFPEFADKVTFVNNGLELVDEFTRHERRADGKYILAVSGGNRPIKNNLSVCKAVEKLIAEGMDITILAFGLRHDNGEPIFNYPFVQQMGQMNKGEYYSRLHQADLYVIASETEPFGLVVGDALNCGCSLLLSKQVGALSIFSHTEEVDIVQNHRNTEELAQKIRQLLLYGNGERLFRAVDKSKCSARQAYLNLKHVCLNE